MKEQDYKMTPNAMDLSEVESENVESGYSSDKEEDGITTPDSSDESPSDLSSGETDETSEGESKGSPTPEERIAMAVIKSKLFSLTDKTNGNRSSDSSNLDSDTSDDGRWNLRYLYKKQRLMKRASEFASQEEAYDASIAKETASASSHDTPLWREAKETVAVLCQDTDRPATSSRSVTRKRNQSALESSRNSKRRQIDLSAVRHLYSHALDNGVFLPTDSASAFPKVSILSMTPSDGMWVAGALNKGNSNEEGATQWSIQSDPYSGITSTVHNQALLVNSKSLEEAMLITSEARLLAQSVPPFSVVHANRAFSVLSGIVSEKVIGCSLESVFQMVDDSTTSSNTQEDEKSHVPGDWLYATLKHQNESNDKQDLNSTRTYKIKVVPVMDVNDASSPSNEKKRLNSSPPLCRMSYILLQIHSSSATSNEGGGPARGCCLSSEESLEKRPGTTAVVNAVG